VWAAVAAAAVAGPGAAQDIVQKPIDTKMLVVKPTRAAADLTSRAMNLAGDTAAGQIESDGYIKTLNNLFKRRVSSVMPTQPGPSRLPLPSLYPSTRYANYNTPVMPTSQPVRR
ncbi:MAG: hypothetical protein K2X87_22145, partial [Gemmataceae bacterium]|nr:hypothetical protein [Gemmataceae bacterium]